MVQLCLPTPHVLHWSRRDRMLFLQVSMRREVSSVLHHFCGLGRFHLALLQHGITQYLLLNLEKDQLKLI